MLKPLFEFWPGEWAIGFTLCVSRYFLTIYLGPFTIGLYIPRKGGN